MLKRLNMKKGLIFSGAAAAIALAALTCLRCSNSPEAVETYIPTKEFIPAYEALVEAKEEAPYIYQTAPDSTVTRVQIEATSSVEEGHDGEEYYDIEETVRILNGLELAQTQSEDFYSFLEYMARQDYSMVPKEVIEAKMELLPIMQEMFILEKENLELSGLTAIFSSLGTGIYELAKERSLAETASGVISAAGTITTPLATGHKGKSLSDALNQILNVESFTGAKEAAFDRYEQQQQLKAENKRRIAELKAEYIAYLNNFTPIYMKYINEWERLSVDKDKAYLAAYSGRYVDCYETTRQILEKYPANREAMLLKALACINMAKTAAAAAPGDSNIPVIGSRMDNEQKYRFIVDAQKTLENYIDLYPGKAAPAMVMLGELELLNGNNERALSYFDQAAIEYPKQAAELKDMLNSYYMRSYLNATPEGAYLMRLYSSTMEGYGWFSPNFHKALYWESLGDDTKAANEIYNHFFRRNNQGIYDCLLTDMEFCETNLYKIFKLQFMESSAMNVSVTEDTHVFGKNGIKITLSNNSDLNLENVRLFVCLHLKDMYTSEYEVFPCETINLFAPKATQSWTTDEYQVEDIVRVRAIMMTDDRVCWVDDVNFKQTTAMRNYYQMQGKTTRSLNIFGDYGLSELEIFKLLKQNVTGSQWSADSKVKGMLKSAVGADEAKILSIELPRAVCLLDPVFSIGELNKNITPTTQSLEGSKMRLEFKLSGNTAYEPIYLYSNFINLKIDYSFDKNGKFQVTDVTRI